MSIRSALPLVDIADAKQSFSFSEIFRLAFRLMRKRQRFLFTWMVVERVAVGFFDLMVAGAMYLLFLLLQGGSPLHHYWWTPKTTLAAALVTVGMVLVRSAMELLASHRLVGYIQNLYKDFLLRLTHGYGEMRWGCFVECNRSELMNHTVNTAREAAIFYQYSIEMIASVAVVMIMTIAIVYQSVAAACGLGTAVMLFYGVHRFLVRGRLQRAASEREQSLRMLQRRLADVFASGKEIRTYQNQDFFHGRIGEQAGLLAISNRQVELLPLVARIVADQGAVLLFLGVVVAVQLRHGDVRQMLSLLVFYFVLSRRLLPMITQISFTAGRMESAWENVRIVDAELTKCRLQRTPARAIQLPPAGFVLELDGVRFSFEEDVPVLRNIHLRLRAGESVVLRGVSGSGKSSLLNLIAGVSQPDAGVVRVDRTSVAYVPQEIILLDDSIRNNLLFGLAEKSDAELMDALTTARLSEFVAALPLGLETGVGDNGVLFSGGQRQRLALARAILRGVKLLLLDEATSALDDENEGRVLENLGAAGIAVVLATHRAHKRFSAERIFRLQQGQLIEETKGPWISSPAKPSLAYIGTKE